MILHCMPKSEWEKVKDEKCWGQNLIDAQGFIHLSTVEYFRRVAVNFDSVKDELVLVLIDENRLKSEVKYEDGDRCGRAYPHAYGVINNDAVIKVLPYLRNADGTWKKNPELADIPDR